MKLPPLPLTVLFAFTCLLNVAQAELVILPNAPAPGPQRVILHKGALYVEQVYFEEIVEKKTRDEEQNGKKVPVVYEEKRLVGKSSVQKMPKGSFRVFTLAGKRLDDAAAGATLAKQKEVLVSMTGKLIDPLYRPLFAPEALVVYHRAETMMQPPDAPVPGETVPTFSERAIPTGMSTGIGLAHVAGGEVVVNELEWDMVNELKTVEVAQPAPDGRVVTVSKRVAVPLMVPRPKERRFKAGEVRGLDVAGREAPGILTILGQRPVAVFLHNATDKLDPAQMALCNPRAIVLAGDFPPPNYYAHGMNSAPPAPSECLARVLNGKLHLRRAYAMQAIGPDTVAAGGFKSSQVAFRPAAMLKAADEVTTEFVAQEYPLDKVKATDGAGQPIAAAALAPRLAKETPVLVLEHGGAVAPIYLERIKPETIVLIVPQAETALPLPVPGQAPVPVPAGEQPQTRTAARATYVSFFQAAAAADEPPPASGPPPRFVLIQAFDGKLILREPITKAGYTPVAEPQPGEAPAQPELSVMTHMQSNAIAAENFRLLEVSGRPVAAAAFVELASRPIVALVSDHGKKVDPLWLQIYKPDTIVAYIKPDAIGGYGHGSYVMPAIESAPEVTPQPPPPAAKRPLRMGTPEELEELLAAAANANDERVVQLLNGGLNINQQNAEGETALMRAAANGHNGYVETLILDHKANPALRNKAGKTAVELAREKGHDATADAITKHLK
jgi:hypothetical protein